MTDDSNAIRLDGVEKRQQHFQLGPLQLEIPKGYVTAIVGPNGSGKSTTFRMLLDITKPDKGDITLLGTRVGHENDTDMKRRIGFLPEQFHTIEDHMKASTKTDFVKAWYPEWDMNRYRELLRLFEVEDSIKLGKMSKGMRRKYELALIMAHHPELLLLDEPSSGLDPLAWRLMIDVFHKYMDHGDRTIVMASHIVEEIKRLADYIVFMAHGRILGVYEKDELFSSWHAFYVNGNGFTRKRAEALPGQCGIEEIGGGTIRIITRQALEAEKWCVEEGLTIVGRQALNLEDILVVLIDQDRQKMRA